MSARSLLRTRTMAERNGARGVRFLRQHFTLAAGNREGDTVSFRRHYTVRICDRRGWSPWVRSRGNSYCVVGQPGNMYTRIL